MVDHALRISSCQQCLKLGFELSGRFKVALGIKVLDKRTVQCAWDVTCDRVQWLLKAKVAGRGACINECLIPRVQVLQYKVQISQLDQWRTQLIGLDCVKA